MPTARLISRRARQAAEALRPLAGKAAYWLFTFGLIGTGMLGVPVLAGSSAYAIGEAGAWKGSLEKQPPGARRFYAVLAAAMIGGLAINFLGVNAVKMMSLGRGAQRRARSLDPARDSPDKQLTHHGIACQFTGASNRRLEHRRRHDHRGNRAADRMSCQPARLLILRPQYL